MAFRATEYPPLKDYALIGDCGSAALVSKQGMIEWLCWPRFDSPSIFAAILDRKKGGCFRVGPSDEASVTRRYLPDSPVLETTFTTETGVLRLTDLMPVGEAEEYQARMWPDHQILRKVECLEGEVDVELLCIPRPNYGRTEPVMHRRGKLGIFYEAKGYVYVLRSDIPIKLTPDEGEAFGKETLHKGDCRFTSFTFDAHEPAIIPPHGEYAESMLEASMDYWRKWTGQCEYDGPYKDMVIRSLLTLKLMTYAGSGALIAAPTTSLPETIGGGRNWDYRYCWLRDATMTLNALNELGYYEEEGAFLTWLLQATRMTIPQLNVMYDIFGNDPASEEILDHLEGYQQSAPVRIGNMAKEQLQLDVYGEVVTAAYDYVQRGHKLNKREAAMLGKVGRTICDRWDEPDDGIWEMRSGPQHNTYSKAMCWLALDRLVKLEEEGYYDVDEDLFREVGAKIRETIETQGYNDELESYTMTLGGREMDASLLLMGIYGYIEPDHPRMKSTYACVKDHLGFDGLLHRYEFEDGISSEGGVEGAFGICSFWAAEYLALIGEVEESKALFEELLGYANDVGLFAEEIDPKTGAALGNFPQAFTHVGLIAAAIEIDRAEKNVKP